MLDDETIDLPESVAVLGPIVLAFVALALLTLLAPTGGAGCSVVLGIDGRESTDGGVW